MQHRGGTAHSPGRYFIGNKEHIQPQGCYYYPGCNPGKFHYGFKFHGIISPHAAVKPLAVAYPERFMGIKQQETLLPEEKISSLYVEKSSLKWIGVRSLTY
jgi:hypothetical protein